MEIKVYIANLGKYNEGELVGEWFTLPVKWDEVKETIGLNEQYEEHAIHDYEAPFKINEYDNIEKLNEWAEMLNNIDVEEDVITAILGNYSDVEEGLQIIENEEFRIWNDCSDMSDIAAQVIEESGWFNDVPKIAQRYFDYEAYGRDLDIEGIYLRVNNDTYVEIIS